MCIVCQVVKRWRRLGREHARIGITESYMRLYNNIILRSLAECLSLPGVCPILVDWTLLLSYVVRVMCSEGYVFVRCDSSARNSEFSLSPVDACSVTGSFADHSCLCDMADNNEHLHERMNDMIVGEIAQLDPVDDINMNTSDKMGDRDEQKGIHNVNNLYTNESPQCDNRTTTTVVRPVQPLMECF